MRTNDSKQVGISPKVNRYVPPPGHPLQTYIHSIWRGQDNGTIRRETILPSGTVGIVFCLADSHHIISTRSFREHSSFRDCFVSGVATRAFQTQPGRQLSLLGISLNMETCTAILPIPASELTDLAVDAKLIFKNIDIIHEKLSETSDFTKQCKLLINWLYSLLYVPPKHKFIQHVCACLREEPTESKIGQIGHSLGISDRHLRRLFLQQVGVSPACYLRLRRFIKTIYLIPCSTSLTKIAYEAHYTDQAHFCHDFRKIAGMTPKEYRKAVDSVPGHIFFA